MIYQSGGTTYTISLQPLGAGTFRATIGDRVLTVAAQAVDGGWLIVLDGQQIRVYAAARGGERWVSAGGETFTLTVPETRRRAAGGSADLTAQMPGQVRSLNVQPGESVQKGQTLLVLEAMKMEIRVAAPADGRIRRLLVKAGDVVDRGQRLVEME
ncbi:MAG TPA: biotin/lipoyl-containing protein [Phototrophicaceae bacterium]|nr:biotin/lipoyl-containing protein [Phototrophicaceae bacterium]